MSLANFLNQTCSIVRPTPSGKDRYNANALEDAEIASGVRCRLVRKSIKVLDPMTSEETWKTATLLLVPSGTDIVAKDKATVDGKSYEVQEFYLRKRGNAQHHMSCIVEALNA